MAQKTLINILLILAIVSLAVFLVNTADDTGNQTVSLTPIQPGSIDRISINRPGGAAIKFVNRNGGWFMSAPLAVRADAMRIGAMLQLLQTPSYAQLPAAEHDLQRFDLAAPALSLKFNDQEFFFGGTNPLEGRRYILASGIIHLITDGLFPQLQQGPVFFISPRLIPDDTLLQSISLPGYEFSMVNNRWTVTGDTDITEDTLDGMIAAWQSVRAARIELLEPADSLGEVIIRTRTGEAIRFDIQQREPVLKLARIDLGITYTIPADVTGDLFPTDE